MVDLGTWPICREGVNRRALRVFAFVPESAQMTEMENRAARLRGRVNFAVTA